jgi:hypothetical protein
VAWRGKARQGRAWRGEAGLGKVSFLIHERIIAMKVTNVTTIYVRLEGTRAIMFDRYSGDNKTKLNPEEKFLLNDKKEVFISALALFSLYAAEKGSVPMKFYGKEGRKVAFGIASYVDIDPFELVLLDGKTPITFTEFNKKIEVHHAVARMVKGSLAIPNPKERPMIKCPWAIEFSLLYTKNEACSQETLRKVVEEGGAIGLGTFRPFFGKYTVTKWEVEK